MNDYRELLERLETSGAKLAVAESVTGGLLASNLVDIEGASKVFLGSVTAYQDAAKINLLDVSSATLAEQTAVSAAVAMQMAEGVRQRFAAATGIDSKKIATIATTGLASDVFDGGELRQRAGLVFVAVAAPGRSPICAELHLDGSRSQVRHSAADTAVALLRDYLDQ